MNGNSITLPPQWQDWQILTLLGRSGHSTVYELQKKDGTPGDRVALKAVSIPRSNGEIQKLLSDGHDTQSIAELYQRRLAAITEEYRRLGSRGVHRNILRWDEPVCLPHSDGIGWDIFLVTELSTPISQYFRQDVPEEQVVLMAKDLCRGLIHCQKQGIVHRAIKPSNIFLSGEGQYKLGDFGAATVAEQVCPDSAVSNHGYTAPEVYNGSPHTHSADIYGLGLSMYWALNDLLLPYQSPEGPTDQAILRRMDGQPIPEPRRGSDELKKILMKACAPDPGQRYSSASDMLRDLNGLKFPGSDPQEISEQERIKLEQSAHLIHLMEAEMERKKQERQLQEESFRQQEEARRRQEEDQLRRKQEENRNRLKKIGIAAAAAAFLLLILIIGYFTIHFWEDAGCGTRPVCSLCGRQRDTVTMHRWTEATCEEPKTCSLCGTAEGSALGHNWEDATCYTPQTCVRCGKTQGTHLEHQWTEATTSAPRTCILCGATDGTPLPTESASQNTEAPVSPGDNINRIICLKLGLDHTVALYADGTVRAVGDNTHNQCDTAQWQDIVQISAYYHHTAALRADGTVYATGLNNYGQCNIDHWQNMISVAAGCTHTVGLREDGTVVAVGENKHGECDVELWSDIVQIHAGWYNTVGIRSDGSILIAGLQGYGQADAKSWTDIPVLSTSDSHIVGLRINGTAVSAGSNKYGQCDISHWTDLAQIHAGCAFTLGLRKDGTVLYTGITDENQEYSANWTDIRIIGVGFEHIVGVRTDGSIVVAGTNDCGQCDTAILYDHQFG